jgi:hypothetical protein
VSRTPATTAQSNERNKLVSVDWAIIHKENVPDDINVFALFHDANIGLVHVEFQPTRGQAGEALEGYIQRWGIPHTIHHDNAQEFIHGKFASVCRECKIHQTQSAPYSPNQNPAERYINYGNYRQRGMLTPLHFWPSRLHLLLVSRCLSQGIHT